MTVGLFAYSRQGCATAEAVRTFFSGDEVCAYAPARLAGSGFTPIPQPSGAFYGDAFARWDALLFVGSCGIAVRAIAPHVRDKKTDPAVLVIDEQGTYVIPLLSGHIGGANALAASLAAHMGATAVVTTATDIHQKFSVDAWAARNGFSLSSMAAAKAVSAAILERDVPMMSDFPVRSAYPAGVVAGTSGDIGICLTVEEKEPFTETLRLVPRILHIGIGCRRGTTAAAIAEAVEAVFEQHHLDRRAVKCAASIDLKQEEAGLLQFCQEQSWPLTFYSAEELSRLPGEFTPSPFVSRVTGVDNVCERAALMGADRFLVRKSARNGVTVALAAEDLEVQFG